ncbi:hypothetical protein KR038_004809 [Drosophila bunnanda]|nr:hypothetical protein KR038_004809 [Drosophila bunnanda]
MTEEKLCKLCQEDQALDLALEKSSYKSAYNLLERLFDCYNIDVSVLGGSPSTCNQCFLLVLEISEQLEKWSNAQKMLQRTVSMLDIEDTVVSVKKEPNTLWDETDDAKFTSEGSLELFMDETPNSNDLEFLDVEDQTEDLEFLDDEEVRTENLEFPEEEVPQTKNVEYLDSDEPQTEDVGSLTEVSSTNRADGVSAKVYEELFGIEQVQEKPTEPLEWRLTPHEFFGVCLGPSGLALAVLFKDKTPQRNIQMLCTCCNQVFPTVSDIKKHSLKRRAHPEYWCRFCGIYFPSITDLKFHEEYQKHKVVTNHLVIRCLRCASISRQYLNAIAHENTVHNKISYDCKKCSASFPYRESLAKHQWKHKNHVCRYPNCQRKFKLWEQYVNHLNWHKRLVSPCPVPGCTTIMMPGDHVKHLRTHSKNQVMFYDGVYVASPHCEPFLINTPAGTRKT